MKKGPTQADIDRLRDCLAPTTAYRTIETKEENGRTIEENTVVTSRPFITWESIMQCSQVTEGLSKNARFPATHQEMPQDEVRNNTIDWVKRHLP